MGSYLFLKGCELLAHSPKVVCNSVMLGLSHTTGPWGSTVGVGA